MNRGVRGRAGVAAALLGSAALVTVAAGCGGIQFSSQETDLVAGKQAFVQRCGACHVLNRAGTKGVIGPNLDQAFTRSITDGFDRSTIEGMVHSQILYPNPRGIQIGPDPKTPGKPAPRSVMPAKLVDGQEARNVAAYVAYAVAKPGKDTGALGTAVGGGGNGKPIAAKNGRLEVDADPNGQLLYVSKQATAPAGPLQIESKNASQTPHNIALQGPGANVAPGAVVSGGAISKLSPVTLKAGKYAYFCTVPGHRQAGMQGTLTVK